MDNYSQDILPIEHILSVQHVTDTGVEPTVHPSPSQQAVTGHTPAGSPSPSAEPTATMTYHDTVTDSTVTVEPIPRSQFATVETTQGAPTETYSELAHTGLPLAPLVGFGLMLVACGALVSRRISHR